MLSLDWNKFGVSGVGNRESFEKLCLHLFCRKHQLAEGVSGDFNQAGLETEPVEVDGKTYGFQSKYFDKNVDYGQISKSIDTSLEKYGDKLDEITVYINLNAKPNSSESGKDIVAKAAEYGVKIRWFTRGNFEVALKNPKNLDLSYFYFGYGAEFSFLKDSADYKKITLIKSKQFLKLNYLNASDKRVVNLENEILTISEKLTLISGDPASGKSTLVHRLFMNYSGLNETSHTKMVNKLVAIGAIPQIINLKLCATDSLESIIRTRQIDYSLNGAQLKIIYLLDGLDELSEERADFVLLQMLELSNRTTTHKIIVTCRSGNFNKIQLRNYFQKYAEYRVSPLTEKEVSGYFATRNVKTKTDSYEALKASNPRLIAAVTDVLGLMLLWDSILSLNETSTVLDLYEQRIKRVLYDPHHYKDLPQLNLPNPKNLAILGLNEKISYEFQREFQYLFPLNKLQSLIHNSYPKNDYQSVNAIVNYIASLFFDTSSPDASNPSYVYKHRRYQEYFFILKLQKEYEKDPSVLRGLSILSNLELFETFFIGGLKKRYIEQNNLVGALDLSLLDVYLGNHSGWGVDSPYYLNSSEYILAFVTQSDGIFNLLFEDESLNMRGKIFIDISILEENFNVWSKDKRNYRAESVLIDGWETGFARLMNLMVDFSRAGRDSVVDELINNIRAVQKFYDTTKFLKKLDKERRQIVQDPYWSNFSSWLYYLVKVREESLLNVFQNRVMPNFDESDVFENSSDKFHRSSIQDAIHAFVDIAIELRPNEIITLWDVITPAMQLEFLRHLIQLKNLKLFSELTELHEKAISLVSSYEFELNEANYATIIFIKKYFNVPISSSEMQQAKARRREIVDTRDMDWTYRGYEFEFAVTSFVIGDFVFEQYLDEQRSTHSLNYYSERLVYSMLFSGYISLLKQEVSLEYIFRQYAQYYEFNWDTRYKDNALNSVICEIWAHIFGESTANNDTKKILMNRLLNELEIHKYRFSLHLDKYYPKLFREIVSEATIEVFEDALKDWNDDFQSKVDRYLQLSLMYKDINPQKASELFIRAIVDGTLRHGWRKDPIIHYSLVNALGLILDKQWLRGEELEKAVDDVFNLVLRAYVISDGSGTNRGPYRFIEILSKYDRELAIKYKDKYVKEQGRPNISNSIYVPIIISKVRAGLSIEIIEEGFGEFYKSYDYEGKPDADYFEQKFIVYLEIAKSHLYKTEERLIALEKCSEQIRIMKEENVSYYLSSTYFSDEVQEYLHLCRELNISPEMEEHKKESHSREYSHKNELSLQNEIRSAKTKQKVLGLYKKVRNYENNLVLHERITWNLLIDKTFEINGDISLFIQYLGDISFPHTDFYSNNSRYAHLGLAHALSNPNYKQETFDYLYRNGGHEGFYNVLKSYAEMNDKKMSLALFNRFVALCKLLTS